MAEQNQGLPIEPTVQASESSLDSLPAPHSPGVEAREMPGSIALGDLESRDALERMTSQLNEQASLLKSTHALLADVAANTVRISDEFVSHVQRPVFIDLIMLYDSMQQLLGWLRDASHSSNEEVLHRLSILESELLEVLARRDVRPFDDSPTMLDRQMHRTVKTIPTSMPEENNRVRQVMRAGFLFGNKVLRPEEVVISKYDSSLKLEGS